VNCTDCQRRLVPVRAWKSVETTNPRLFKMTHARAHARGLCSRCYQKPIDAARRGGDPDGLIDHERQRLTHEDIMDEYEILGRRGEGFTDAQIASRLGIHITTLRRHIARETDV
jgi:AraC-like DNA-binding protein